MIISPIIEGKLQLFSPRMWKGKIIITSPESKVKIYNKSIMYLNDSYKSKI